MGGLPLLCLAWLTCVSGWRFEDRAELEHALSEWRSSQRNATERQLAIERWGRLSSWNVAAVTNMSGLFQDWRTFNEDIGTWNTSAVRDMSYMFAGARSFNQPIGRWATGQVANMSYMFSGAAKFNQDLSFWDTSSVTSMSHMFATARAFNTAVNDWNTSRVSDMSCLFCGASAFNRPLSGWNTTSVTRMNEVFAFARRFDQSLSSWDTSSVTDMRGMFSYARAFNQSINMWDTSGVTDMSSMFSYATTFNQPLGHWNVTAVKDMSYMFKMAKSFQRPIGTWNTAAVEDMHGMFQYAAAFNQPVSAWNTAAVRDMIYMFYNAKSFNQDVAAWNVSSVLKLNGIFHGATSFDQSLSTWQLTSFEAGPDSLRSLLTDTSLSPCRALRTWEAWRLTRPTLSSLAFAEGSCPSCPEASRCPDELACVGGRCAPVTMGFVELGVGSWAVTSEQPKASAGFRRCADLCQTNVSCPGFLLRGDRCSMVLGQALPKKLPEPGDDAVFWKPTCNVFPCRPRRPCPIGQVLLNDSSCGTCPRGFFARRGALACEACSKGTTPAEDQSACIPCPRGTFSLAGEATCRDCGFPLLLLSDACAWWHLPLIVGAVLTLMLAAYASARSMSRRRQKQEEVIMKKLEEELWDEEADTVDRHATALQAFGVSAGEVERRAAVIRASQSANSGVALRYLLSPDFANLARDRTGEDDPTFHRMQDAFWLRGEPIGASMVCPRDGRLGCALVDWLPRPYRQQQTHYLSWTWMYTLDELRGALQMFANSTDAGHDVFFSMCFFVNNQFRILVDRSLPGSKDLRDAVAQNLSRTAHMVVVLNTWHEPVYLTRIWAIYELFAATTLQVPVTFAMPQAARASLQWHLGQGGGSLKDISASMGNINSAAAKASDAREEEALKSAVQEGPGFASVDQQVSTAMMCWLEKWQQDMLPAAGGKEYTGISVHEDFISV